MLIECNRVWNEPDFGGMPDATGIAARLAASETQANSAGSRPVGARRRVGASHAGVPPDGFVHELDGLIGDNYPVPDRMWRHVKAVARRFMEQEMFGDRPPGRFDYFATEGGTAAMCYVFNSLTANRC